MNFHGTHDPANTYEELGGFVQICKQNTKTKKCLGKLLTDTTDLTKFTSKQFYDSDGNQRTAVLIPVALG